MKAGNGEHFEQAYKAAVETQSRLIVAVRVTDAPNDKEQLVPTVQAVPALVRAQVAAVLADNGFYSATAVAVVEANGGPIVAAVEKTGHHRSVKDLEQQTEPVPPPADAVPVKQMRYRLRTKAGRALYRLRQQTVEAVFGIIKEAMGFRRFALRGMVDAELEWTLVCLAYKLRRLHRLTVVTI